MKVFATLALLAVMATNVFAIMSKSDVVGTWLLNGTDKSTKWVFNKDDTFVFKSAMASSKGTWSTNGTHVKLVWTHVDGQPVKPGAVKGQYKFNDDGSLQVDNYVYKKKS